MLGYPVLEAQQYADAVRRTQYKPAFATDEERRVLDQLLRSVRGMEIAWTVLAAGSPAAAKTLGDARIREETGATVIAILQNQQVIANPDPATVLNVGDVIGLLGEPAHVAQACQLLGCERRLDLEAQIEATLAPSPVAAS